MYESTKSNILELLHKLPKEGDPVEFDLTGLQSHDSGDDIKLLLSNQQRNFKAIDRAMSKIIISTNNEKWELEDNLNILKSKWAPIDKLHWEIDSLLKGSHEDYYRIFVDVESRYDHMRKDLSSKIWSTAHYQQSAPRIEIPEFSGNYNQWISFKDLFIEAVHNNPTINKAQKMQHLKTKLRGEAERLVQHLTISAENYVSCWDILNQRYDNRRLQFISFMNTLLQLPIIQQPEAYNLRKMHDTITECLSGLSNIGLDISTWDPIIVYLMAQKLDSATHNEYVKELRDHREVPVLHDFLFFLESKFMAYETMRRSRKDVVIQQKPSFVKAYNKEHASKTYPFNYNKPYPKTYHAVYGQCPLCDGRHVLMQCPKFIALDVLQRNNTVAKLQVCKNCLFSHGDKECKSNKTCKECNMKHHSLLHNTTNKIISTNNLTNSRNNNAGQRPSTHPQTSSTHHLATKEMEVLLTTVKLKLQTLDGTFITLRALLDQGSQVNLITQNAAQLLRLPRRSLNATISGIGELSGNCKGKLQLTCKSLYSDFTFETEAMIIKKLTNNLPNATFEKTTWPHLKNLQLADTDFNVSRPVDLLLGADVYADIIMDGVLKGDQQSPVAQQTHLGWILCGKLTTFNCHATLIDMNELTQFWENEDISQNYDETPKDDQSEEYYNKTIQRDETGKYIVKMPLCTNFEEKLGKSRQIAVSQFLQLEKRLERQEKVAQMYKDFIKEYVNLQHMAISTSRSTQECYLPHHSVLRENATSTKLRVVFNASQKTSTGYSLNSLQEKGPNLQKDIQALIIKWRSYKYAFTADIEKMYRCIWMSQDQQPLQKIIWRNSPSEPLQEYQLCTVTYGTKSAPWLAMRTLKQLAMDDGHKYPEAAKILQTEFYVDDLVSGHSSIDEAKQLQESLINLLQGGGMNLRKWSANHPALLENLTEEQKSTTETFDFKHEEAMKTLGIEWNPKLDTLTFNWNVKLKEKPQLTKRVLLSEISKLYDPLGWMSPVTIIAKLLFQKVWLSKLNWDDGLPSDITDEWLKVKNELPQVNNLKLNRWIGASNKEIELLGFCDASEKAFSCVIYTRTINEAGKPIITLLTAKTRVAPLAQKITLPKLELCGALLLSKLMKKAIEAYTDFNITTRAWCDSQVVLAWLQGDTSRWEKYIANRVSAIKQIIPAQKWQYIKSELNPADCASRGLHPSKLIKFDLWWHGPAFLKTNEYQEEPFNSTCLFTTDMGTSDKTQATLITKETDNFIVTLMQKHSSLTRVIRVTAWILRFSANVRNKKKFDAGYLTTGELTAANEHVTRCAQKAEFTQEYKLLWNKKSVSTNSCMYKLNPYLDKKGIIRVGGRLNKSSLPSEMKNPIILPKKGPLTQLIIHHGHMQTLHGGARLTLAYIRQRYWIIGGNRAVKDQLRHCVRCLRFKPTDNYQLMADLPPQRTNPSRPFTHTGVDFTGHVEVKINKGRGVKTSKGYIAVFVCMATKAVHIELASDMSTETFLAAFQRMCARRGTPKHMYSDCGTNFVGASKVLRNEFEKFEQILSPSFFDEIGKLEVEWHFNVPAWPTAGGLWESSVKFLKYHLRRVLGEQKLTYEEFTTLLAKIEACMNSRPLCPLTEDPDEFYHYLTPGHFLTGTPILSLPLSDHSDVRSIDLRRRWQLTEHMMQQFWKHWSNDYLCQLQKRSKWNKPTRNIKEGDIVLLKEDNLPPGKWALGRVIKLHPGTDGYVRVATMKTQNSTIKRPVVKLAPLPVESISKYPEDIRMAPKPDNQKTETNAKKPARSAPRNVTKKTMPLIIIHNIHNYMRNDN